MMKSGTLRFGPSLRRCLTVLSLPILFLPPAMASAEALVVRPAERAVTLTGYTRSRKTVTLSCEVSGKVLQVHYDIGDRIGDAPFLRIDTTFVDLQIEESHRTLDRLGVSRKSVLSRIAFLEKEFTRVRALFEKGSAPEQKRDAAGEALNQARLELETVEVETAATRVRLKEQQERRLRHTLFAPGGWIVTERHIEPGERVQAGTPVARVSDFSRLVVPLTVSDETAAALKRRFPEFDVRINGVPAKAAIHWINPRFDERTRKRELELLIRDFQGPKRGGLTCKVHLQLPADGLRVPAAAVLNRYEYPRVFRFPDGDAIPILIVKDSGDSLIIADDPRLSPGTVLMPPEHRLQETSGEAKQPGS